MEGKVAFILDLIILAFLSSPLAASAGDTQVDLPLVGVEPQGSNSGELICCDECIYLRNTGWYICNDIAYSRDCHPGCGCCRYDKQWAGKKCLDLMDACPPQCFAVGVGGATAAAGEQLLHS